MALEWGQVVSTLIIPIIPTAQQRARHANVNGLHMAYKSKTQKVNEHDLDVWLRRHAPVTPHLADLRVDFSAFLPIPDSWSRVKKKQAANGLLRPSKKPDLDNYEKQLWDSMVRTGWMKDDSQVVEGFHAKYYSESPRWEITVTPL